MIIIEEKKKRKPLRSQTMEKRWKSPSVFLISGDRRAPQSAGIARSLYPIAAAAASAAAAQCEDKTEERLGVLQHAR